MSIMPWKNGDPTMPHEGLYGSAKAGAPNFLRDLGVHIFGKRIDHIPGAMPGKRVVRKAYGPESNPLLGPSNRVSKPKRR
jgi:hypothetical protein